jgi:hypothetical protein
MVHQKMCVLLHKVYRTDIDRVGAVCILDAHVSNLFTLHIRLRGHKSSRGLSLKELNQILSVFKIILVSDSRLVVSS